jgi:ribonuclease HI
VKVYLNTDAGVRAGGRNGPTGGRTGRTGIGFVIRDAEKNLLKTGGMVLDGEATVNEGEYSAVIAGLYNARMLGATEVVLQSDSQLVVHQLTGKWQIKTPRLQEYCNEAKTEIAQFDSVDIQWVPRESNSHADQVVREYLDA